LTEFDLEGHFLNDDLIITTCNLSYNLPATICRNIIVRIEGGTSASTIKLPACSGNTLEAKIAIVMKIELESANRKKLIIIVIRNTCNSSKLSTIVTKCSNYTNINNRMDEPSDNY
jgi:hypothetical protein